MVNGVRETNDCEEVGCQGKNMKNEVIRFEGQSGTNEVQTGFCKERTGAKSSNN